MSIRSTLFVLLLPLAGCAGLVDAIDAALPTYAGGEVDAITLRTLPPSKPGGGAWDRSGAADPYVVVRDADGGVLFRGETVRDAVPSQYPLRWALNGVRAEMEDVLWVEVLDDDLAEDDVVARYRVRLSEVGGVVKPDVIPLQGPGGETLAEMSVRWIEAAG
ncbi:MAG: hypothetical protein AAGK21_00135 [Bacteroidota bacterium]